MGRESNVARKRKTKSVQNSREKGPVFGLRPETLSRVSRELDRTGARRPKAKARKAQGSKRALSTRSTSGKRTAA